MPALEQKKLINEEDRQEIEHLLRTFPGLKEKYVPVCRIGEGTFSTVYKALDMNFYNKKNAQWIEFNVQDTDDVERINKQLLEYRVMDDELKKENSFLVEKSLEKYFEKESRKPHFVALKCITKTSSPVRILDEITFIHETGGKKNVIPLIEGMRHEDQIIAVFPYVVHQDFREYLSEMNISDISRYMFCLFNSLSNIHSKGIIHRDIKPSNFIFIKERNFGLLVDFGLAQRAKTKCREQVLSSKKDNVFNKEYFVEEQRQQLKAARAGTRGFRAPEVLFKHVEQTTAVDVWSAGIIFLTLLTKKYPFFNSYDDIDALVEISYIFGEEKMKDAAGLYKRRWSSDLPCCPEKQIAWRKVCAELNEDFSKIPEEAYDLLEKCLCLNMNERITAEEALKHTFIREFCQ